MDTSLQTRWLPDKVELAIEWNEHGVICHFVEPLGAFIRGTTEARAIEKAHSEYASYARWLRSRPGSTVSFTVSFTVTQRHRTNLHVQDADSDILLDSDRINLSRKDVDLAKELLVYSAATFEALFKQAALPDRVDSKMTGATFYGERPDTIRRVFTHVDRTQDYYMSRVGLRIAPERDSFVGRRKSCVSQLSKHWPSGKALQPMTLDDEQWTYLKVVRRFLWHDRIHAKSIVRMLQRQVEEGAIPSYVDPFRFFG